MDETALREVLEETGFNCRIVAPLEVTRHRAGGSVKEVTWYAMRPLPDSPGFAENNEVDRVKWLAPKSAIRLADYANDKYLIATTDIKSLAGTGTLYLVRHGLAGQRSKWEGDDRQRPLDKKGRKQAAAIADRLAEAGIERIVSSPFLRCVETAKPLANRIGAKVEIDKRLGEDVDPDLAFEVAEDLAGQNAVLCSHGGPLQAILKRMKKQGMVRDSNLNLAKGSMWQVEVDANTYTKATYTPPK